MIERNANANVILWVAGITPGVNPDDLKFYLSEIHRMTKG